MHSVQCNDVSLVYKNGYQALHNINFSFNPGNVIAYLGPNGAGKTSTIKILSTTLSPTKGSAYVCGYDVTKNKHEIRQRIGLCQQNLALDPMITVLDNITIFGELKGLRGRELKQRINYLLESMNIASKQKSPLFELSGGQVRKLQLIRELLVPPEVLFLDEPTAGLDIISAQSLLESLKQISDEGKTIFIASHRMKLIESFCSHVLFLNQGKVLATGTKQEFIQSYAKQVLVSFNVEDNCKQSVKQAIHKSLPKSVDVSENQLKYLLADDKRTMSVLLKTLAEQQVMVDNLQVNQPSLEDAWLNICRQNSKEVTSNE